MDASRWNARGVCTGTRKALPTSRTPHSGQNAALAIITGEASKRSGAGLSSWTVNLDTV